MHAAMIDLYRVLPAWMTPRLRGIVSRIAQGDVPVLVHCAAGKDRTGIAVALLLAVLDVPRETIVEDYLLTNTCDILEFTLAQRLQFCRRTPATSPRRIVEPPSGREFFDSDIFAPHFWSFEFYCFFPTLCAAGTSPVLLPPATFALSAADSSARMPARIPVSA